MGGGPQAKRCGRDGAKRKSVRKSCRSTGDPAWKTMRQHRDAAFATPNNICAHSSLLPHWIAAQTLANLSAHLHRLPTPPPYLRRMRLSHDRGRRYRVLDEAVASQGRRRWMANAAAVCSWRSSCKSPRTLSKCKYLIARQLTFKRVLGEHKLRPPRGPMCPRGA